MLTMRLMSSPRNWLRQIARRGTACASIRGTPADHHLADPHRSEYSARARAACRATRGSCGGDSQETAPREVDGGRSRTATGHIGVMKAPLALDPSFQARLNSHIFSFSTIRVRSARRSPAG